jgi:hypothetical protein
VVVADGEVGVRFVVHEAADVSKRMAHADAEATSGTEHPSHLSNGASHVGYDLEGVVGDG